MVSEVRQRVVVQPGGLVEVRAPELPAGATVEVVVRLETSTPALDDGLSQWIGAARGGFESPEEVDRFLRQERNAWDS